MCRFISGADVVNMTFSSITPVLIGSRKFPQEPSQLESELTKMYTEVSQAINVKTNGLYETTQVTTGDVYFSNGAQTNQRQSFRKVFTFGTINAGTSSAVNHELTGVTSFVHIYGTCNTDAPDARPIPYVSATNVTEQIQVNVTSSQVIILNGAGADNILSAIIVLEYLLN